ncbi:MAG: hypothetical protein SPLM_10390 [Spiroplasma phoeniceum]
MTFYHSTYTQKLKKCYNLTKNQHNCAVQANYILTLIKWPVEPLNRCIEEWRGSHFSFYLVVFILSQMCG